MGDCEADHDIDVFLSDVQLVLRTKDLEVEVRNGSSQLEPPVGGGDCVKNSLSPPFSLPAVTIINGIKPGNGKGHLGDLGIEGNERSIIDVDSDPVNFLEDNAPLIKVQDAIVDKAIEQEIRMHDHNKPIIFNIP